MDTTKEMSYDERRALEKAKDKETREKMREALALIKGFKVTNEKDEDNYNAKAEAVNDEGVRIWCRFSAGYGDKRIHASGIYPRTKRGEYVSDVYYTQEEREALKAKGITTEYGKIPSPSITISAEKTPAQIARDIERRLLPDVLDFHRRVVERVNSSDEYHDTSESALEAVKKSFNDCALSDHERTSRHFSGYIEGGPNEYGSHIAVSASRNEIKLELSDLSVVEAVGVIAWLKAGRGQK